MNKVLIINTADPSKTVVKLKVGDKEIVKSAERRLNSQVVLELIDILLKGSKVKIHEISEIEVFQGPGSFTGLRVGITVANAIAEALGIKVNGKKQIVDAKYK